MTDVSAVAGGNSGRTGGLTGSSNVGKGSTFVPSFIPVRNEFEVLSDDDDGDPPQPEVEQAKKPPRIRLPPIYIMDMSVADVFKLLNNCGVPQSEDFLLKHTKTSVQFLTKSKAVFDKTVSALRTRDVKFFTHDSSEKVPTKFVLSGLPLLTDISDLGNELARVNIHPRDIKVLSSTKSAVDQHALYLLYFDRGSTKIQDLRKTKALFNLVVSWRYFSKRANDAAQCHRCQRFGHGSSNCNLPPKCVKCSGKHLTDVCALPRKADLSDSNNNKSQLKCANCGGSHTANFRGCPTRKTYLEDLEKRKKKPSRPLPPSAVPNPQPPGFHGQGRTNARPPPVPAGRGTYAQVTAMGTSTMPNNDFPGDDLFTITEFLSLARDMFLRLNGCRTKQQQFFALSELMVKYLCHG